MGQFWAGKFDGNLFIIVHSISWSEFCNTIQPNRWVFVIFVSTILTILSHFQVLTLHHVALIMSLILNVNVKSELWFRSSQIIYNFIRHSPSYKFKEDLQHNITLSPTHRHFEKNNSRTLISTRLLLSEFIDFNLNCMHVIYWMRPYKDFLQFKSF